MGEIRYEMSTEPLSSRLAEQVYHLACKSMRAANQGGTYNSEGLEFVLNDISPQTRPNRYQPLFSVLAYDNGSLIGTGFVRETDDLGTIPIDNSTVYLYGMYTDPSYQGNGIGGKILQEILKHLKAKQKSTIIAKATDFPKVKEFYVNRGFESVGEWKPIVLGDIEMKFHEVRFEMR